MPFSGFDDVMAQLLGHDLGAQRLETIGGGGSGAWLRLVEMHDEPATTPQPPPPVAGQLRFWQFTPDGAGAGRLRWVAVETTTGGALGQAEAAWSVLPGLLPGLVGSGSAAVVDPAELRKEVDILESAVGFLEIQHTDVVAEATAVRTADTFVGGASQAFTSRLDNTAAGLAGVREQHASWFARARVVIARAEELQSQLTRTGSALGGAWGLPQDGLSRIMQSAVVTWGSGSGAARAGGVAGGSTTEGALPRVEISSPEWGGGGFDVFDPSTWTQLDQLSRRAWARHVREMVQPLVDSANAYDAAVRAALDDAGSAPNTDGTGGAEGDRTRADGSGGAGGDGAGDGGGANPWGGGGGSGETVLARSVDDAFGPGPGSIGAPGSSGLFSAAGAGGATPGLGVATGGGSGLVGPGAGGGALDASQASFGGPLAATVGIDGTGPAGGGLAGGGLVGGDLVGGDLVDDASGGEPSLLGPGLLGAGASGGGLGVGTVRERDPGVAQVVGGRAGDGTALADLSSAQLAALVASGDLDGVVLTDEMRDALSAAGMFPGGARSLADLSPAQLEVLRRAGMLDGLLVTPDQRAALSAAGLDMAEVPVGAAALPTLTALPPVGTWSGVGGLDQVGARVASPAAVGDLAAARNLRLASSTHGDQGGLISGGGLLRESGVVPGAAVRGAAPFVPVGLGVGAQGAERAERDRQAWQLERVDAWGALAAGPPAVVGRPGGIPDLENVTDSSPQDETEAIAVLTRRFIRAEP